MISHVYPGNGICVYTLKYTYACMVLLCLVSITGASICRYLKTYLHWYTFVGASKFHKATFSGCALAADVAYSGGSGPIARRQDLALKELEH